MRIIDISVPIQTGMVVFDGDPVVELSRASSINKGDLANVSRLTFGVHTGTHVDAPLHFLEGVTAVDTLPLDVLIGRFLVVDATAMTGQIDAAALAILNIPSGTERLILKTQNSSLWDRSTFTSEYIGLKLDGAQALVEVGIRLVGIDYLSISTPDDPGPPHISLLSAGVVILEGLDLRNVEPGVFTLVCLPLRLVGADGAPARTILLQGETSSL